MPYLNTKGLERNAFRIDGTPKGLGWKGPLIHKPTGKVMTELSIGHPDSKEGYYPLIVPDLTDEEVEFLSTGDFWKKEGGISFDKIPKIILQKARKHYLNKKKRGENPFFDYPYQDWIDFLKKEKVTVE